MNNGVIPHADSREPKIYLDVSPINNDDTKNAIAGPNSEYVVKFVVPEKKNDKSLADLQYVLELVNGKDGDHSVAKFTSAPPGGGLIEQG